MAEVSAVNPGNVRYHGLDALRAWAMSMGIVLHAAWIMIPGEAGAPMSDASASSVTDFICLGIHTFRMQLFFVLAGLFACLLLRKRGLKKFSLNRTLRIVLPLAIFWLILCPIMMWQYNAAGIASGAIQSDQTAWQLTQDYLANLAPSNAMLLHLWFLYYLCWVYVLVFAARGLLALADRNQAIRGWVAANFGAIVSTPWSVLLLAVPFAALMMPMKGTWGIDIEYASLFAYNKLPGLLTYTAFFVVGWLIYRNIDKLSLMIRGWRWQLALGLLLIAPYYVYSKYASQHGYSTWNYPQLVVEDLRFDNDQPVYSEFRENLMTSDSGSVAGVLWQSIPEENRQFVEQHESASQNQLNGLLVAINTKVLGKTEFSEQIELATIRLSGEAQAISQLAAADRTVPQIQLLNREILNAGFAGIIYSEDVHRPFYYPIRAAYCYTYSLITWLMIFGCIGFSQNYFNSESRFWRYFSDSSYWFYLAHLPIQFQLLLWLGDEPWHWTTKFAFYVVATVAVLLLSYHILVRPTWIGWLLNGRMASVWNRREGALATEPGIVTGVHVNLAAALKRPGGRPLIRADEKAPRKTATHAQPSPPADEKLTK